MTAFEFCHNPAHIFHAFGRKIGFDLGDRSAGFFLAHLLGEKLLDHCEFAFLLVGEFLPSSVLVHLDRFATLLGHFQQDVGD